jgi:hypothetical protein
MKLQLLLHREHSASSLEISKGLISLKELIGKKKVKQSRYRSGVAQGVPGS